MTTDPRGPTYTEAWRHACEVKWVLRLPGTEARRAFLEGVERFRGAAAANRLRADVLAAWQAQKLAHHQAALAATAPPAARAGTGAGA